MSKIHVRILIEGPGSVVNQPLETVVAALQNAGCTTEVTNKHPSKSHDQRDPENRLKSFHAKVVVEHLPWGG